MTREQLIENFADSVEQERIALGYSQAQMAQALDMSLSTYKRIINGEISKLDFFIFYQLYQLTGKFAFELCKYGDPLSDTVASMRRLSQPQLRTIRGFVDFEDHFARSLNDKQESSDYTTLIIPSGCMYDGMIYDSCSLGKINIASYRRRFHDKIDCAILITTNHLNPTYNVNDILLIDRSPIQDGDTGIFLHKETGMAYIRRFRRGHPCRLEPIGSYGKTLCVDGSNAAETSKWIKFGRVLSKIRSDVDFNHMAF